MHNWDLEVALSYHEGTKHSYESVYRSHHFLDWSTQPQPFKVYDTLPLLPLPAVLPVTGVPALRALLAASATPTPLSFPTLPALAHLLWATAGVTKRRTYPGYGEMCFRAAACTGALYHIDLYLAVDDLPGLGAGLYHFDPQAFALRCLRQGDYRAVLSQASGTHAALQEAPVVLIYTDTFWRNAWKYRARAYRHGFWDAGTMLANLGAAARAQGVAAHLVLGFVDAAVNALLDLDARREAALCLVAVGEGCPVSAAVPAAAPLALPAVPSAPEEQQYPAIQLVHAASGLETPEEAEEWRGALPESCLPAPTGTVFPLPATRLEALPAATLEEVIQQRGSARHFAPHALALAQLATVLQAARQPIGADFLAAPEARSNELYLIIHAVETLPAGAYVYHPQLRALELLAAGDFRQPAGALALGQDLAADASVAVFCLCDLGMMVERFGNRGYRAAQLEGGLLGGRLYLAAYAQGLGASGLTFFDDEVIEFFSPHAAGKSVMFLLALGHAIRPPH
ncbi:MAG: SagB family peptide dehydrogenase [Candidatus Tectimicrobiota bacterium]